MIEEYHFGSITIDGKTYTEDIEVRWTGEVLKWWRSESHIIDVEDIKRVVKENPDTIIIGTGEAGIAKVTEEAQNFIQNSNPTTTIPKGVTKGIKLIIDKTEEAIRTFNVIIEKSQEEEGKPRKVIGLFHLTC